MTPLLLQRRTMAMMLLIAGLGVKGVCSSHDHPPVLNVEHNEGDCPPCELLFGKLEKTGRHGKLAQDVRVQQRGEPKSGTGVMFYWATASLMRTCDYLQELFGGGSCRFDSEEKEELEDDLLARYPIHRMIFEPGLGKHARCSCHAVDTVSITISMTHKHTLPVTDDCAFSHGGGISVGPHQAKGYARDPPCKFADGGHVHNHDDLWRCMHEADCKITDDWIQMGIYRDPRPAIVSTYYHAELQNQLDLGDLNDFVTRELPIISQWLAVRYILFSGALADLSVEFWYRDAMADPLAWHYQWLYVIGLQLPFHVVEGMVRAAVADNFDFEHKEIDIHPGEEARTEPGVRRFEDEVSPEVVELADDILRKWLPPVLLERFGVVP